jgi:hypothetical protein
MRCSSVVPALGREICAAEAGKENVRQTSGDEKSGTVAYFLPPPNRNDDSSGGIFMIQQPLLVLTLLVAIAAVACDRSGGSASKAPELSETTAMVRSTADLENAVKAKFKADEQLRSAELGVSADSTTNEITVSGAVESQILRSKAVDLARSVDSGVTVNNQIEVKPSGRTVENVVRDPQRHG